MKIKLAVHQQAVRMDSVEQSLESDREELITKKKNLLVQDYRSRLPLELFHSSTKATDSIDSDVSTD